MGRPSSFKPEYIEQAAKLALLGATDIQIADFFEVSEATINRWKYEHDGFRESLKVAKEEADQMVEKSLYRRALGFEHDAVKIFLPKDATEPIYASFRQIVPPDTTACIFWLKNRKKAEWRDKLDHEHTGEGGGPLKFTLTRSGKKE